MRLGKLPGIALLAVIVLCGLTISACAARENYAPAAVAIADDYLLSVEDSVRDGHNMIVHYSLVRRDGGDIDPALRFEALSSMPDGSGGSTLSYVRSEDGKKLQIEERWSNAQIQDKDVYSVMINDLVCGWDEPQVIADGSRTISFRTEVVDGMIDALRKSVRLETVDCGTIWVSEVQLSPIGLHIKMRIPDADISRINDNLSVMLIKSNGEGVEIQDDKSLFLKNAEASLNATLCEEIIPSDVRAVVLCGQVIPIEDK